MVDSASFVTRELTASIEDRALLGRFYAELYIPEFPDPDERESLTNMERYLELKAVGWYGRNNYHIGLVLQGEAPVAGVILDYLAEANAGVIEFLVVAASQRNQGLGTRVLNWAEQTLEADARQAACTALDWVLAEINDPFRPGGVDDNVDPFTRTAIWSNWGFTRLDFPYIQPALSVDQKPVYNLLLAAKILRPDYHEAVPASIVETVVHEYLRWAMRIEDPQSCGEFRTMQHYLRARSMVGTIPLARYMGRDPGRPLEVHEITEAEDPDLDPTLAVYGHNFPPGPTSLEPEALRRAFPGRRHGGEGYAYHLWALRGTPNGPVEGIASFFTFPKAGFGGYVSLAGSLRGTGRLRLVMARMEAQMIQDGLDAFGWYAECRPDGPEAVVLPRLGFYEVALTYRQPWLDGAGHVEDGPVLRLLYKEFGRDYEAPRLSRQSLFEALGWLFRIVYSVAVPEVDPNFNELRRQAAAWPDDVVRWRASGTGPPGV